MSYEPNLTWMCVEARMPSFNFIEHENVFSVKHEDWKAFIGCLICFLEMPVRDNTGYIWMLYMYEYPLWFWWFAKGFGKLALYKKKYMYKLRVKLSWILKNLQGTVLSLVRKRHEGCTVSSLWVKKKKSTCAILGFHTYLLPWKGEKLASFSVIRYPLNL